jgi:MFS family permease
MVVNFAVGGALMATLVAVPLFAGATTNKSEVASALVLVRFLIAVPFGALAGGWLCRRFTEPAIAAAGMVVAGLAFLPMTSWGQTAFTDPLRVGGLSLGFTAADVELVICGLGFGLVIAPVNNAMLRAVPAPWHGLASALTVVARMIGMLVGLSILVAIALRTFYAAQRRLGSPITLCPSTPTHCPAYNQGTTHALIGELHTIFAGAAVCAAIAAVAALITLRRLPVQTTDDAVATPSGR